MKNVDSLIDVLSARGFSLDRNSIDGRVFASNELWFERHECESTFSYILITFGADGALTFGSDCGVKEYEYPDDWIRYAHLIKMRFGILKTFDLGSGWLLPFKRQIFQHDWRYFMNNIDGMVHFLETGEPNKNLSEFLVAEYFERRST